jgi:hypothetical protein
LWTDFRAQWVVVWEGGVSKGWDLTSLNSLQSAAKWVREGSGALLVLVVRAEDVAFAVDEQIAPSDALTMVEVAMPDAMRRLEEMRLEAKARAKVKRFQGGSK